MTYLDDAKAHLVKAREFLEAARDEYDFDRLNACVSSAVISGVNSKDAICLKTTKHTNKTENHNDAIAELKQSGPDGATLATTLGRLLAMKPKSQYQAGSVSARSARDAVNWAQKMYDAAVAVVTRSG
jgi:hypothetical protein